MSKKPKRKTKAEKEAEEFEKHLEHQRRIREAEALAEMRVTQRYATIEGQPYSIKQLRKKENEWVKQRIIY